MTGTPPTPTHDHPEPVLVTLSEERVTVTTEAVPTRRAVLRIETTSEEVMVPVTITRQHAYLDYVDIDPATAVPVATDTLLAGAAGTWLVLTADEPVVSTRPIPVERVRLATSWVTAHQDIHVQVAHEELTQQLLPTRPTPT